MDVEMISQGSGEKPAGGLLALLRTVALIAALVGAVGSVGLLLQVGRRKHSPPLLLALFAMLVVALGSLAIYGDIGLGPLGAKTVPVFVIVPPASLLLIAIVVPIPALLSARLSRR